MWSVVLLAVALAGEPATDSEVLEASKRALLALKTDAERQAWFDKSLPDLTRIHRDIALRLRRLQIVLDSADRFGPLSQEELRGWMRAGLAEDPALAARALLAAMAGAEPPTDTKGPLIFPEERPGLEALRAVAGLVAEPAECIEKTYTSFGGLSEQLVPYVRIGAKTLSARQVKRWILSEKPIGTKSGQKLVLPDEVRTDMLKQGPWSIQTASRYWNSAISATFKLDAEQLLAAIKLFPQTWPADCSPL